MVRQPTRESFRTMPLRGRPRRCAFIIALSVGAAPLAAATLVAAASGCSAPAPQPVHIVRTTPRLTAADMQPEAESISPLHASWEDHSLATRLAEIGPSSRERWKWYFDRAGVSYPPSGVRIVVLKRER